MSKELKFRICYTAQNGDKNIIYSDDRFLIGLNGEIYENYGKDWKSPAWESPFDCSEPPIIQQYTTAHDKNGKEIYEGDILNYRGRIGIVEFFASMYVCCWDDETDDELAYMMIGDMEVIGNIFETPHLKEMNF